MSSFEQPPVDSIVAAVIRLLADRPRTSQALADALSAEGFDLGRHPQDRVEDFLDELADLRPAYVLLNGETLFWPSALLAGSVFTHRVTPDEVRHDLLLVTPDLAPLGLVVDLGGAPMPLTDGTTLRAVVASLDRTSLREREIPHGLVDDDAWLLEPGWFERAGVAAGDVVAVTLLDGRLRISRTEGGDPRDPRSARARTTLHDLLLDPDEHGACEIDQLVATAIAGDPALFSDPVAPLAELLEHSGVTIQGDYVCAPGVDLRRERQAGRLRDLQDSFDLDVEGARVALVFAGLVARTRGIRDTLLDPHAAALSEELVAALLAPDERDSAPAAARDALTVRRALDRLADPDVAVASAAETLGIVGDNAAALELTTELLEPMVSRQARVAVRWLRAKAQERLGRVLDAEQTLEAAYSLDPQWDPVLFDLARYAGDRGDAERGLSLLQRAGAADDDVLRGVLEAHRASDRADLGRNDPCWCGSGRRYKACHRGRERLDLPERAGWLYAKAWTHLMDGRFRLELMDAVRAWNDGSGDRQGASGLGQEIAIDSVLFEGGAFEDFVATRGVLLPDDERLLAEQWLLVDRSVHEVDEVRRGRSFTTRDIRTGDRHEVTERLATRQLTSGDLILARLVPDGRDAVIVGGVVSVDLARRDMLVALLDEKPDPIELVRFVRALYAPPVLVNADGTDLVLCEARLRVADADLVVEWLDAHLGRVDADASASPTWHATVDHDGGSSIRASATLNGSELVLFTTSEQRFDDLLTSLVAADPNAEMIEQARRTVDDVDPQELAGSGSSSFVDPRDADPALAAALHEYVRGIEQRWLDESIPALGGVTPRQAATDPTRRDDLVRLLDSFPQTDDPGHMSPLRLRQALDLA